MKLQKRKKLAAGGILVLKKSDSRREREFELDYLSSLNLQDRFVLMLAKSAELKTNLAKNGHRETASIIKRT
jgi:hypothetical protein